MTISGFVVPRVGTWIEIIKICGGKHMGDVVPRVGTWIEILREYARENERLVVPRVGTWIEIGSYNDLSNKPSSRPPRGDVD